MSGLLPNVVEWASDVAYSFGYLGIAFLVMLGNLHLPVPTELTLPLAGFLVGQGRFSFFPALVWTTVAAVASSLVLYFPGRWFGEERLRRFVGRFGRFVFVRESDLDKAKELFDQHGGKAILIGRLIPGVGTSTASCGMLCSSGWGGYSARNGRSWSGTQRSWSTRCWAPWPWGSSGSCGGGGEHVSAQGTTDEHPAKSMASPITNGSNPTHLPVPTGGELEASVERDLGPPS
jgi:membrane protein YqaA with SNARE-associated domain